jgi:hypothetical protein
MKKKTAITTLEDLIDKHFGVITQPASKKRPSTQRRRRRMTRTQKRIVASNRYLNSVANLKAMGKLGPGRARLVPWWTNRIEAA